MRVRLINAVTMAVAVRTTGAAGLGTGAQRFIDDGLDGARATAALGAASETTVNLLVVARKMLRTLDGTAHIIVAKHVTGTDDHLSGGPIGELKLFDIQWAHGMQPDATGKAAF